MDARATMITNALYNEKLLILDSIANDELPKKTRKRVEARLFLINKAINKVASSESSPLDIKSSTLEAWLK